jgi:hypothetical protein
LALSTGDPSMLQTLPVSNCGGFSAQLAPWEIVWD